MDMGNAAQQSPPVERPLLFKAALHLRVVTERDDKEDVEAALADLIARIERVSLVSAAVYGEDPAELTIAGKELAIVRNMSTLLQEIVDVDLMLPSYPERDENLARLTRALEAALERVNSRRAYLAWVLDEDDDRQLGREIVLPQPDVTPGPSSSSFAW